jgi:hypothetical protein
VRKAITVAGVTSTLNSEYTPTDSTMSCTTAASAPTAMRHSRRVQVM